MRTVQYSTVAANLLTSTRTGTGTGTAATYDRRLRPGSWLVASAARHSICTAHACTKEDSVPLWAFAYHAAIFYSTCTIMTHTARGKSSIPKTP